PVYLFLRKFSLQDSRGGSARVENGAIVSHCRIKCLQSQQGKSGAALIYFVDGLVTDGFILRENEFVTSLQSLKEAGLKAGFSAFEDE
ncbi:hypothetical protein, partial [Escherichia coli]